MKKEQLLRLLERLAVVEVDDSKKNWIQPEQILQVQIQLCSSISGSTPYVDLACTVHRLPTLPTSTSVKFKHDS